LLVDEKLSISLPKGWEARPTDTASLFYGPNGEVILVRAVPRDTYTQATWSADAKAYWEGKGPISAATASTVGGAKSSRLTHTFDMNGPYFSIAEAFIHGGLAYDLEWWSPVGNEIADTATFQKVVDSAAFTK
jgi:hypothetical protein